MTAVSLVEDRRWLFTVSWTKPADNDTLTALAHALGGGARDWSAYTNGDMTTYATVLRVIVQTYSWEKPDDITTVLVAALHPLTTNLEVSVTSIAFVRPYFEPIS